MEDETQVEAVRLKHGFGHVLAEPIRPFSSDLRAIGSAEAGVGVRPVGSPDVAAGLTCVHPSLVVEKLIGPRDRPNIVPNSSFVVEAHAVGEGQLVGSWVGAEHVLYDDEVITSVLCPSVI